MLLCQKCGGIMGYRIIIADDERKIMQLIKQLGHWDKFGIEIVDECHDGKETLMSILKNKPDLVMTDIKMPECDGIELIEKVRQANLDTLFILLSGYRHFEYARSAIQLKVIDYLLKPIDEKQLNETLEKACAKLDQIKEQNEKQIKLQEYEVAQDNSRLEEFWSIITQRDRIRGEHALRTVEICNNYFPTDFIYSNYQIIYVDTNLDGMLTLDNSLFSEKVCNYINSSFRNLAHVIFNSDYMGHVIVLNFDENKKMQIKNAVLALFYHIRDLNELYGNFRINIGCSKIKVSCSKLIDAFEEAIVAEWGRLIFLGNMIIDYDQIAGLQRFASHLIISSQEKIEIQEGITYLKIDELGKTFGNLYNKATTYNNSNPQDMMQTFYYLQGILKDCISNPIQKEKIEVDCYFAYQDAKNFQQIFKNIFLKLEKSMIAEQKIIKEKMVKPIEEAVRFMRKNYTNLISLEDVAEVSNVSASYLSRLFKEEMEIGYNEYLTQIRMEEAKKMLSDTNMSVKDIAAQVGYPNEKYYSKLFKKLTGITPTDYRRLYG